MAIVMQLGDLRAVPMLKNKSLMERVLENPFFKMEMARVELSRAEHPSKVNEEGIIYALTVGAVVYIGLSACWFVKYVI